MQTILASKLFDSLLILICCFAMPALIYASQFDGELRPLTMKDGLADNIIETIYQDKDGFMWFGTQNGISRYDGRLIKNFTIKEESFVVNQIKETQDGKLWLSAGDGRLYCFDRALEEFCPMTLSECVRDIVDFQLINDSSFLLLKEHELLYIKRKNRFDKSGNLGYVDFTVEKRFSDIVLKKYSLSHFCFSLDRKMIYIVTEDCRLLSYSIALHKITLDVPLTTSKTTFATSILCKDNEYIWVSSIQSGVFRFHLPTQRIEQYVYKEGAQQPDLSHTDAYGVLDIGNGSLFSITWNGFTFFRPGDDKDSRMIPQTYMNNSFAKYRNLETRMISSFFDSHGILWIGTRGGGVLSVDLREQLYQQVNFQYHNQICAQVSDAERTIWLATFHKGIMRSNHPFIDGSTKLQFSSVYNKNVPINSATKDNHHNLWFGNSVGELICYDSKSKSFSTHPLVVDGKRLECSILSILVDSKDNFWVGTNEGLYLFERWAGKSKKVTLKSEKKTPFVVTVIKEDKNHGIWLGTNLGLFRLERNLHSFNSKSGYEESQKIRSNYINSLLVGSDGTIYVGYRSGFGVVPKGEKEVTLFYTTADGLCNNDISCIIEDAKGGIWIGNASGVSYYSRSQHLFYNYYISGSNKSAMLLDRTLFWGNNKYLTFFEPDDFFSYPSGHKVLFTGLEINNKLVNAHEQVNGQIVLEKYVSNLDKIELNDANRDFSLCFSSMAYSKDTEKYAYRLYPYQCNWLVTENEYVSYTNLPAGDYTFEVKPLYPNHVEGQVSVMSVVILPHWSQTFISKFIVALLVFSLLGYFVYWLLQRQRNMERLLNLKHELFVVSTELDREKHVRKERERFFITAAHEVRTPLTLIISPLQGILKGLPVEDKLYESLSIMNKNCTYLNTIVNDLLYVEKIEADMIKLYLSEYDMVKIVRAQTDFFRQMAEIRECEFTVQIDVEKLILWLDVRKIESALTNLLSNAFKYTPQKGVVRVSLSKSEIDGKELAVVSITDSGIGIAEQDQKTIFNSFVTSGKVQQQSTISVGIGLYIVKNTMNLHHGHIAVDSRVGEGSCFTLYIPLGNEHFSGDKVNYIDSESLEECVPEHVLESAPLSMSNILPEDSKSYEKKFSLLIIEDNEKMRCHIGNLLSENYTVIEAVNGAEGLRLAIENIPDLIISDVMMPVMDGFECCQLIKSNPELRNIPIIMLTAKSESIAKLQSLRLGIDDYIIKPFNPDVLSAKVKSHLVRCEHMKILYNKSLRLKLTDGNSANTKEIFMQQVIQIIEENLAEEKFSVKILAEKLCMSQPTLYRKIRQQTNLSIIEVIQGIRMTKAASLILERKYTLADIASQVGFESLTAFRKHFVEQFGILPSKFGGD